MDINSPTLHIDGYRATLSEMFRELEETTAVKSIHVYDDGSGAVDVHCTFKTTGGNILQVENVTAFESEPMTLLFVAYNPEGNYIGNAEQLQMLFERGIVEQIQPYAGSGCCSIGFAPTENKWYGWSHRTICGFGIGSNVEFGDCAFEPNTPEVHELCLKNFWDHGVERTVKRGDRFRQLTTRLENVRHNVTIEGVVGMQYDHITRSATETETLESLDDFSPYPVPWGRGAWTAQTLDDAKEMASAYASSVS